MICYSRRVLQSLNRKIIFIRRQLAADAVVRVGIRLRELEANQQDDPVAVYPEIERLERQRERLLAYIRRTAQEASHV